MTGQSISNATLSLLNIDGPSCGTKVGAGVQVRRVTGTWDPLGIIWSNQPGNTTENAVINTSSVSSSSCAPAPMNWDITAMARQWAGGTSNNGLVLMSPSETKSANYRVFPSSEEAFEFNMPPKLTVTYLPPPDVPEVTVNSADLVTGNDVISRSDKVRVVYGSASSGGENLDYSTTISDASGPITGPPDLTGIPSGQVNEYTFAMGNPDSFKVSFKACVSGRTPPVCSQTPAYRITSNAPHPPTGLVTGLTEPTKPILSGVVSRPSAGLVTGRFFLYDDQGNAVGGSPFGEGVAKGGGRVSLQVPDGTLTANRSYSWQMQACVEEVCSAKSSAVGFATAGSAPQDPVGTHTIVLDGSKLAIRTAKTAADGCGSAPCALTDATAVQLGGTGPDRRISLLKPDLTGIPEGAQITSAILALGSADCGGTCPAGAKISVYAKKTELSGSPTGAELVSDLISDPEQQTDLSAAQFDVTGNARQWRRETPEATVFVDPGLVLLADENLPVTTMGAASGQTPISLVVKYLPPTAPGKVTAVRAREGDGGALLAWGKPETPGGDASISGYDIQVLNAAGGVLRTLSAEEDRTIISGLTNGTSYRFQVRARTTYGTGPWQASDSVTPRAVIDSAKFVGAAQQFVEATEGLRDRRYTDVAEAVSGDSQAAAILPILYTNEDSLLGGGTPGRNTSEISLSQTLVSAAADGSVIVRARITGKTTYDVSGTPLENGWEDQSDFVFAVSGSNIRLTRQDGSEASDASTGIDEMEINAWAGGIPDDPALPLTELQGNGAASKSVALAGNLDAAVSWAVKNVGGPSRAGWEYPNDCANFVSKALARGGRYRQIHDSSWSWLDKRSNASWWESSGVGNDSWTFTGAQKNYNHFAGEKRVTMRKSVSEVQKGDLIYFINRKTDLVSHMGIVTYRFPYNEGIRDIYFAQHGGQNGTGSGPYMSLSERYDSKEFKGLMFAKVNW
ncbi:DNRLRE domain-containing protein [Streptosporangium pseudovulgare]|uniref:Fibronectin type-III domain-containing protein n=1 Tax=Streptosporangium pseudovulgare TaxID=35765 RepID=A0ABQ2QZT9_9ACTN|nr:DNRLRE domain-containing protein [Streptosporangium pseudovulgare]GGQ00393.1 hypothetical protein GCM10010140_33090 [Streptosporangium pseudovulgare]